MLHLIILLLPLIQASGETTIEPERTLEKCASDQDGYLPSGISSNGTILDGSNAYIRIDYPAYMFVTAIQFEGLSQTPALNEWTNHENADCAQDSYIDINIPTKSLAQWGTASGAKVEFSIVFSANYWSYDRVYGEYSKDNIQKEIQVEITAPTTTRVEFSFELHPDSVFTYDVQHSKIDDERNLHVQFKTRVNPAYEFNGTWEMTSDFFQVEGAELGIINREEYYDPQERDVIIQTWSFNVTNVTCIIGRFERRAQLLLTTLKQNHNGGFFKEEVTLILVTEDTSCEGPKVVLEDPPNVYIGDDDTPVSEDSPKKTLYINDPLNLMLDFPTTIAPETTTLKGFHILQDGNNICPSCHENDAFSFKCESCLKGTMESPGSMYNMTMFLHEDIFIQDGSEGGTKETTMEMEFEFAYPSSRRERRILAIVPETEADFDLTFNIKTYDCLTPYRTNLGDHVYESCAKGGRTSYVCQSDSSDMNIIGNICSDADAANTDDENESLLDQFFGLSYWMVAVAGLAAVCCMCCICFIFRRNKAKVVQAGHLEDMDHLELVAMQHEYDEGYNNVPRDDPDTATAVDDNHIAATLIGGSNLAAFAGATPGGPTSTPGAYRTEEDSADETTGLGIWGPTSSGAEYVGEGEGEGEITLPEKRSPATVPSPRSMKRDASRPHIVEREMEIMDYAEGPSVTEKRGPLFSVEVATPKKRQPKVQHQLSGDFEADEDNDGMMLYSSGPSEGVITGATHDDVIELDKPKRDPKEGGLTATMDAEAPKRDPYSNPKSGGAEVEDSFSAEEMTSPSGGADLTHHLSNDFLEDDDIGNELYGTTNVEDNGEGGGAFDDADLGPSTDTNTKSGEGGGDEDLFEA